MAGAFAWGLLAASSLVLGGLIALHRPIGRRPLGLVMGFGAGVLISAVAFELVEEAFETSDGDGVALGLLCGSLTYFAGDLLIEQLGAGRSGRNRGGPGLAIVVGTVLDGVPESMVLGLTVLEEGRVSAALLVAVFLSNLPEAIAASSELADGGWSARRIVALWSFVALASAAAALAGYALFGSAGPATLAFVLAFAGGAILCMLADTMMPEAFAHGGRAVGLVTTLGFALAFAISAQE
jgi:ZIP family zinc transporter